MKQQNEILHIEPKKTIYSLEDENEISEKVEKKHKPLQFDNASQSIDFKNINFDIDNLRINEDHDITKEEILDIDVDYELIKMDINDLVDSKLDEQIVIKKLQEIDVIDPIQVLDDGEKIYSNENNDYKHFLNVNINEIEVIDPVYIIPYVTHENNSFSKNAEDNLENEKNHKFNPIDSPIVEGLAKRTEQRKIKLKEYNYKFPKSRVVGEMDSEPAYKRAGISLDDEGINSMSSTTLNENKNGNVDIKSNNTFLHDNVD